MFSCYWLLKRKKRKPTVLAVTRTRKLVSNMLQLQFGFLWWFIEHNLFSDDDILIKHCDICIERLSKDDIPIKKIWTDVLMEGWSSVSPIYRSTGKYWEGKWEKKERSEKVDQALVENQTLVPPAKVMWLKNKRKLLTDEHFFTKYQFALIWLEEMSKIIVCEFLTLSKFHFGTEECLWSYWREVS